MRHKNQHRKLNRTSAHRQALLRNLAIALIKHETIVTTLEKARELRRYVEPLINKGKSDSVANRRYVFACLHDRDIVGKIFNVLSHRIANRNGGYTRTIRYGYRPGDNANKAVIQLTDKS